MKMTIKEIEARAKELDVEQALSYLQEMKLSGAKIDKIIEKYLKKQQSNEKEAIRFSNMCIYENELRSKGYKFIAGIDEAGRGPLAGPVVTAAVVLPEDIFIYGLNDSKKLSQKQRESMFDEIKSKALFYSITMSDRYCIDEINILNATKKAMIEAVNTLGQNPDFLLVDAVNLDIDIQQLNLIQGDSKSASIAAASVLAKVTRDRLIEELDSKYPQYGFAKHKGYGTAEHIEAIKKYGLCEIHRRSFTKNFVG